MGTDKIGRRLRKIEQHQNLPADPVAVCFMFRGETKEMAWRRHLELFPQAEASLYRTFIQVVGSREKQEDRFYSYPIRYGYRDAVQKGGFSDDELTLLTLDLSDFSGDELRVLAKLGFKLQAERERPIEPHK